MADDLKSLHATALAQFKFIAETEHDQRESELEALRFEAGDQWSEDAKRNREGVPATATTPAVPARPMLTMRTLDQPLAQISSMAREADLAIKIIPKDGQANEETAEIIAGLCRSIEADSHAQEIYQWGFQRMRTCGRGYWRVNKSYANDEDGFDQVLRLEPIKNGASVYLDPMPSWVHSGGFWEPECGFITEDISEQAYKRRYGTSKLANLSDDELTGLGDAIPHWVIDGEAGRFYRIAEYFYATYSTQTLQERNGEGDPLEREIVTRTVKWAKMNGVEFLEPPQEWDGRYIPIIPDTGNHYNLGGKDVYEGMVQPNISPCRMLNYMVSAAAEKIGLATLSPWLAVAGQLQGYEAWWKQANVRNFPYLEYNATTPGSGGNANLLPPPTRNNDTPQIQAFHEMIALFTNFIRSTTGVPDAALGHVNPNDKSGRAIAQLQRASEQGASNWLGYHARAIRHTGCVLVDLIPHVYDRPGRVERIIGADSKPESVMLNAPFTPGPDGQPQPHQPSMWGSIKAGAASMLGMGGSQPAVKEYRLDQGKYSVIVDVGKGYKTQNEDDLASVSVLINAAPEVVPRIGDLLVKAMPIRPELRDEIAARLKPPDADNQQLPPEAQAQIAALTEQLAEAQQGADENRTKLIVAAHADETKLKIADIQAQTQLAVAEIKAGVEDVKAQIHLLMHTLGISHQEAAEARAHAHELGMSAVGEGEADKEREYQSGEAERERAFGASEAERDRAVAIDKSQTSGAE